MTPPVLLLAPSDRLGGGIERYVSTVEAAFTDRSVPYRRISLATPDRPPGARGKLAFLGEVVRAVRASPGPVRLVLAHGFLAPVLRHVTRLPGYGGATVILHGGKEIWSRRRPRARRLLRRPDVRVVTVSSYSAGALAHTCPASVLHPGVSRQWYDTLVAAAAGNRPDPDTLHLVTSFRLGSWQNKGLATLVEAVRLLDDRRVRLTVCGPGPVPDELARLLAPYRWCRLAVDLTDQELAATFAAADVFALCTRTRTGRSACGEGFGLVLLEAQLAGTPVVAPAYGGSAEAFQAGQTGVSPVDESAEALAAALDTIRSDPAARTAMGQAAAAWSRSRFEPEAYGRHVTRILLDGTAPAPVPAGTTGHG